MYYFDTLAGWKRRPRIRIWCTLRRGEGEGHVIYDDIASALDEQSLSVALLVRDPCRNESWSCIFLSICRTGVAVHVDGRFQLVMFLTGRA